MRILRGLTSRLLSCGCIAGIYETYDGAVVTLLDDRHERCADPSHVEGQEVPELVGIADRSETPRRTTRSRQA